MKSGGAEELAAKRHGDNGETQWLWRLVTATTVMVVTMAAMAMVTAAITAVCDGIRWHGEGSRQARQLGQEPYERGGPDGGWRKKLQTIGDSGAES